MEKTITNLSISKCIRASSSWRLQKHATTFRGWTCLDFCADNITLQAYNFVNLYNLWKCN